MLTKKMQRIKVFIVVTVFIFLYGCASKGSFTPEGYLVTDVRKSLKNGEVRLNCHLGCAGAAGANRRRNKAFYDNELWHDLAISVSNVGFQIDREYYYLGRAAEGLGYYDAARTYYKLAKAAPHKCGGVVINVCDGLEFPRDIDSGLNRLKIAIEEVKSREDAKVREEANARSSSKEMLSIIETPATKIDPKLASVTQPLRQEKQWREDVKLEQEERLRKTDKREEQEFHNQEIARRQEQKKAKQQEDADRRVAESKNKGRALIRKATTQERSMIIGAANQNLFDSESARYGSIYVIPNSLACVEVNEKNRFGDYAGFQNIVAKYISGRWFYVDSVRDVSISCLDLIAELHEKAN